MSISILSKQSISILGEHSIPIVVGEKRTPYSYDS